MELQDYTEQVNSIEVDVNDREITQALKTVFEVFINFFMPETVTIGVPGFHNKIWSMMTSFEWKLIAIGVPRGHAKTTLAKLAVVWYFLFTDVKFIVYLCNTADLAEKATVDIMEFFQTPNFIKLFGAIQYEVAKWGEGEFIFWVKTPFNGRKRCILKARGAGQRVRGLNIKNTRPEVAVVDDFEDADDLDNPQVIEKNQRWFFGTFYKALDRRVAKIIYIGNMISNKCLLYQFDKSQFWRSMVLGAILKDGSPLWPEMWSIEALIQDYQQYVEMGQTSLWFAEMMNLIIISENALIRPEQIYYRAPVNPDKIRAGFVTIDPATGNGNDDTAIVAHALVEDGFGNLLPQVVDYRVGQIAELETVKEAVALCYYWGFAIVGIEAAGFQSALEVLFNYYMKQEGIMGIDVVKVFPSNKTKLSRIRAWCALVIAKGYAITMGEVHITSELLGFDVSKDNNTDNLIDACAQGPVMIEEYLPLILSKQVLTVIQSQPVREAELN